MPRWTCGLLALALVPLAAGHLRGSEAVADAVADGDATVTAAPEAPVAVLEETLKALRSELEDKESQWLVALLAFIFGCVLVFDGEFCLRWLIAFSAFLLVASIAMNQVTSSLGSDHPHIPYAVGLEAGCIAAFAAFKGMDGMRVAVGALLGVLLALKSEEFFQDHGITVFSSQRWFELVYYSLIALLSSSLLYKNKHLKLLCVLSAGLGGAFCASAVAFLATELETQGYLGLDSFLPGLSPKTGTWLQFLHMLWSSKAPQRGLFVGSQYNPTAEGHEFSLDKIADVCLWIVFWLVGSFVQLRRLRRPEPPKVAVREPLLGELPKG